MAKVIPEPVVAEVARLLEIVSKRGKRDLKKRKPWENHEDIRESVGEEEQQIEHAIRRAKRLLAKYKLEPTPARATKAAKWVMIANLLRLISSMTVTAHDKRTVPSEVFPFQIPGLF